MKEMSKHERLITVYEGGIPDQIPYYIFLPSWARERLEKEFGEKPEKVFHLDWGVRDVYPRSLGKAPWDLPWDNPPDNPEEEKALWSASKNIFQRWMSPAGASRMMA